LSPSTEPLARLATPLVCPGAEVLYAGLAPGRLDRLYQVDLLLGPGTGYLQFICPIPGRLPFALTLTVAP